MKKYEYKESRNFARLLGSVNAVQIRQECVARAYKKPLELMNVRVVFFTLMLKVRYMLEKARLTDFVSQKDYPKLKEMWWSILKREYKPGF